MKKLLSIVLAAAMLVSVFACIVNAENDNALSFNEEGKFRIVHLTDVQDTYPMNETTKQFIKEMLVNLKPDLVVLGGDNCVADKEVKDDAIKELCDIFVEDETYFTLVFGNHDHQNHFEDDLSKAEQTEPIKEELFAMYKQHGGEYCLAYDAEPALTGVGTHNLPVYSSDGSKVAYNLYMMDSNTYYPEEDDNLGYDGVHPDQLDWYKGVAAQLKEGNNGTPVPALMFQHIVLQEAYKALFIESAIDLGEAGDKIEDSEGNVTYLTYLPKVSAIKSGIMSEHPCPNYHDYGQMDAIIEAGDVKAVFSGHDHTNTYTVEVNGIRLTNSGGCTYHSYGDDFTRGVRVIDLDESDLSTYTTYTYTVAQAALEEGSLITSFGDISKLQAKAATIGTKLLSVFVKFLSYLFFFIK